MKKTSSMSLVLISVSWHCLEESGRNPPVSYQLVRVRIKKKKNTYASQFEKGHHLRTRHIFFRMCPLSVRNTNLS